MSHVQVPHVARGISFVTAFPINLEEKKFLELISRECLDPHDSIFPTLGSPLCQFFTSLTSHVVFTKYSVNARRPAATAQWVKPDEGSADTWP
jgi:hypothetical protein